MNITPGTELFGVEVVCLRDALRETSPTSVTPGRLADRLGMTYAEALELCARLAGEGTSSWSIRTPKFPGYALNVKGGALRNASAARRVRRATAERHLAGLLERVREVNANEELLFVVEKVLLFGSMLGDAGTVGDVDVAVELVVKTEDRELFQAWARECLRVALAAGRRLDSVVEQVTWPTEEILRFLKAGSAVLSLTTTADRVLEGTESRLVYERSAQAR